MGRGAFDTIIIGQGLAGTTLAWQLRRRGVSVLVVDGDRRPSASRVAAGLITPVTGKRMNLAWRFHELWPAAVELYRYVEESSGAALLHAGRSVRLFVDEHERELFDVRERDDFATLVARRDSIVDDASLRAPLGGFEMLSGGRLDVPAFLDASRRCFGEDDGFLNADVDVAADFELTRDGVRSSRLGIEASRLILCRGFSETEGDPFEQVRFRAAKGETLTVRIPGLEEKRPIHARAWLAPDGDDRYRVGATYTWDPLDSEPSEAARLDLCRRLSEILRLPFDVLAQQAGVRPILEGQHPIAGLHPNNPAIGIFNGLGSKGASQAPFIAGHFADALVGKGTIDPELAPGRPVRGKEEA